MAHSVNHHDSSTDLDEIVQEYGLSKADQKSVIRLVNEKVSRRPATVVRKRRTASSKSARTMRSQVEK